MNRTISIVLWSAVVLMLVGGVVAVAMTMWGSEQGGLADGRALVALSLMVATPLLLGGALVFSGRHLSSQAPRLAADHRAHLQASLLVTVVSAAIIQTWLGLRMAGAAPLDRELFLRLIIGWSALALVIRGNFMGKLDPPKGEAAPNPAAFSASMRRAGWSVALIGLGLLAGAILLPLKALFVGMLAAGVLLPAVVIRQRRAQAARP